MTTNAYKLLTTGGYANVYYHKDRQIIKKVQPTIIDLDETTRIVQYSSVVDLATHASLDILPGLPVMLDYSITPKSVKLYMPYYGKPLHKAVSEWNKKPDNQRGSRIMHIFASLIDTCMQLEHNGIQHTDIKPSNVLISEVLQVTLIDFNIVSSLRCHKDRLVWESAIGTWNYCAPEITEYLRPSDTSMVWSIGLLIAYICYRCPFYAYPMSDARRYKHKTWRTMIQQCRAKNPRHLPLTDAHMAFIPTGLYELYEEATAWDPKNRISLKELREKLRSIHFPNMSSFTPWISRFYADPTKMPSELRKPGIQILYSCCKRMNMMTLFCNAVSIFDRCHAIIYPNNSPQIMGAILYLLGLMKGYYVIDNPKWTEPVCELLKLKSFHELEPLVWEIGEWVRWEVLEKGADVYLAEKKRSFIYSRLRRKLLSIQKPYCMQSLAEEMI